MKSINPQTQQGGKKSDDGGRKKILGRNCAQAASSEASYSLFLTVLIQKRGQCEAKGTGLLLASVMSSAGRNQPSQVHAVVRQTDRGGQAKNHPGTGSLHTVLLEPHNNKRPSALASSFFFFLPPLLLRSSSSTSTQHASPSARTVFLSLRVGIK